MKKLKDEENTEVKIIIKKIREHYSDGQGGHSFKDKLRSIEAIHSTVTNSTAFPCTKEGDRKLIKFIKEQLYIK